jgi:hypothetical protein
MNELTKIKFGLLSKDKSCLAWHEYMIDTNEFNDVGVARPGLLSKAIHEKLVVHRAVASGTLIADVNSLRERLDDALGTKLISSGAKVRAQSFKELHACNDCAYDLYVDPSQSNIDDAAHAVTNIVSTSFEKVEAWRAITSEMIVEKPPVGEIKMITRATPTSELEIESLGRVSSVMERENYTDDVLAGYDAIIADIKSSSPAGRISIMDGPPGTGKTFLVRSIAQDVPGALFVLVPSHLISEIGSPEMLSLLIKNKVDNQTVVLLIEDADAILSRRASDNMVSISNALNISDGIVGELLNLRMVATTNAAVEHIDPALLRPGRLSRRITVGLLTPEHAAAVYARLLPDVPRQTWDAPIALAAVYAHARENGWIAPAAPKRRDVSDEFLWDVP